MDALQPGDPASVGCYRLLSRLGVGGMGRVFLGVSPGGRKVAVKLIHPVHTQSAQFRDVIGLTTAQATRVLQDAGFEVQVNSLAPIPDQVFAYSPAGQAPRGSTITIDVGLVNAAA